MTTMHPQPNLEPVLVSAAQAGDTRAFEALYRSHVGRVHAICCRLAKDASSSARSCASG